MRCAALVPLFVLVACAEDAAKGVMLADATVADATVADAMVDSDASGDDCEPSLTMCREGIEVAVGDLCFRSILPPGSKPSAGLYTVCNVSPAGELYLNILRGDTLISSAGWTHSGYGNGNIKSTLSASDEARCTAARAVRTDAGGLCSRLF